MPQDAEQFSGIFINYRRDDSSGHAGRLFDRLSRHFGDNQVFIDIDHIEPGVDFVEVLENSLGACEILITVIGKHWLLSSNGTSRRLDDPNDFVRVEIAAALNRNIRVIPVLVGGATMPGQQDLPEDLSRLSRRQYIELSDQRWNHDIERLITALEKVLTERKEARLRAAQKEEEERKRLAAEELHRQEEERRKLEEEERSKREEEEKRKQEEEEERKREEAAALATAEEQKQREAEAERQHAVEEERQREAEQSRQREAEARSQAEELERKKREAEEAERQRPEAEEVERRKLEEEEKRKNEEAAALAALEQEERQRVAEEWRQREDEARRAEELDRKRRQAEEVEHQRRKAEESQRQMREKAAAVKERRRLEEEETRKREEADALVAAALAAEEQKQREDEERRQRDAAEVRQREEERLAWEAHIRELNRASKPNPPKESPTGITAVDSSTPASDNRHVMLIALYALVVLGIVIAAVLKIGGQGGREQSSQPYAVPTSTPLPPQNMSAARNTNALAMNTNAPAMNMNAPVMVATPDKVTFEKSLNAFIRKDRAMKEVAAGATSTEISRKVKYGNLYGDAAEDAALWFCGENSQAQLKWCKLVAFRNTNDGKLTYAASAGFEQNWSESSDLQSITEDGTIILSYQRSDLGDVATPIIKRRTKYRLDGNKLVVDRQ